MYYVDLIKDNEITIHAPFKTKQAAIDYFNIRVDSIAYSNFEDFDRIEIFDGKTCLFDYEV